MKTVIFVRHAKSSWDNPGLADFERPLNKRGKRDSPFMGKIFKEKNIKPDLIISSPAVRALTTAINFAKEIDYPEKNIKKEMLIYEYGPNGILRMIQSLDNSHKTIMVFGHNPDLTHLSTYLSGEHFVNVPTSGTVCIDFDIDSWKDIIDGNGKLRFFEYPKKYLKKKKK